MMRLHWIGLLLLGTVPTTLFADPGLQQFFAQHCVKCHGEGGRVKGKVNLRS